MLLIGTGVNRAALVAEFDHDKPVVRGGVSVIPGDNRCSDLRRENSSVIGIGNGQTGVVSDFITCCGELLHQVSDIIRRLFRTPHLAVPTVVSRKGAMAQGDTYQQNNKQV